MSYAAQVASYREMEILSATPERLVLLLFDHLVVHLHRVRIAIDGNDIAVRTTSLGKARAIVSELLATLDFERGGRIAADLSGLYTFLLSEMLDVGVNRDVRKVQRLSDIVETLRSGFSSATVAAVPVKRPA